MLASLLRTQHTVQIFSWSPRSHGLCSEGLSCLRHVCATFAANISSSPSNQVLNLSTCIFIYLHMMNTGSLRQCSCMIYCNATCFTPDPISDLKLDNFRYSVFICNGDIHIASHLHPHCIHPINMTLEGVA